MLFSPAAGFAKFASPSLNSYCKSNTWKVSFDMCIMHRLGVYRFSKAESCLKRRSTTIGPQQPGQRSVNHISFAIRAFVRLEVHRLRTGVSWYEAKTAVVRESVRQYLQQPLYLINSTA